MSKVITFSRVFPYYHPRKGEPTYFVEKIWKYLWDTEKSGMNPLADYQPRYDECFHPNGDMENIHQFNPKGHTIRAGHHWKAGDRFSPRIWSGKPYNSKQIIIAPDIEVVKTWDFVIYSTDKHCHIFINGREFLASSGDDFYSLMKNDGLTPEDFRQWFQLSPEYKKRKRFDGQIICWNKNIEY